MLLCIKIYLIVWFICYFQPIQEFFDRVFTIIDLSITNKTIKMIVDYIYIASGCMKCQNLWIILFFTFNPFYAIFFSMLAQLHSISINKKNK